MNNKITMPELLDLLAQKAGCTKKDAEFFLKEFFGLASEVISGGESLKINGLGIFKTIWVEKRASVNIQTGLPFEIPGHYKLTFTPDKNLKEAVNAPFSCFEAEILPDDIMPDAAITAEEEENDDVLDFDAEEEEYLSDDKLAETVVPESSFSEKSESVEPSQEVQVLSEPVIKKEVEEDTPLAAPPCPQKNSCADSIDIEREFRRRSRTGYISGFLSACLLVSLIALGWLYFDKADSYKELNLTMHPITLTIKKHKTDVNENKDSLSVVETMVTDSIKATAVMLRKSGVEEVKPKPDKQSDDLKTQEKDSISLPSPKPLVEEPQTPVTETVRPGVFLTTISLKHYGHKTFWVYIYEENKKKIQNPNNVPIGTVLIIPDPDKYGIDSKSKESVEKAKVLAAEILENY